MARNSRAGVCCICNFSLRRHFDGANRFVSCRELREQALQALTTLTGQSIRDSYGTNRADQILARRAESHLSPEAR